MNQIRNSGVMTDSHAPSMETEGIARRVREFYDCHPYPPPVDDLDRYRRLWDNRHGRRADYHLFWPDAPYREDRSILVAGCGTSQAAKYALRWPHAKVIGIDVSATSIKKNLLPVEQVTEMKRCFEHVVCTGVLHHLSNPDAGLRALCDVMARDSTMHMMVYAPYGRAGIYLLQDYCRQLGIGTTRSDIFDLAASLRALQPDHPLVPLLRVSPDFRDEAALADALLHPQDRAYSVPQFFDFVHNAGLQFARWIRQAAYLPQCGALATSPHQPLLQRLPMEEQYAAVELFRGTMLRHSAVVYLNDRPGKSPRVSFDGDAWLGYVPIRTPETLNVQERLPPGAAAVLINRAHTYTDLYMPINAREKRLVDAIDGEHTIGEIARVRGDLDTVRIFFKRLWWYDQVVFDASSWQDKTNPTDSS
jgi:SAM-dependent methyltransferase